MSDWFYLTAAEEVGPVSAGDMVKAIRAGAVCETTMVRKGDSQWVEAQSINGLFDAAYKKRIFYCPFCQSRCEKPPTTCTSCHKWFEISEKFRDPAEAQNPATDANGKPRGFRGWVKNLLVDND